MADAADLASVVGTWVAAALGIIALAGILPVYLLHRASRTERNIALGHVHDPHHMYITSGLALWRGKRYYRTLDIPGLTDGPPIENIPLKFNRNDIKRDRSHTGWANFANLLHAYDLRLPTRGVLEYEKKESHLPVHRGWLLLIGIHGRYNHNEDCGVLHGQFIEPEMVEFGKLQSSVSELTGMLCPLPRQPFEPIDAKICFRMHSGPQIENIHSENIPMRLQLMLFLGLLPGRRKAVHDVRKFRVVARGASRQFTSGEIRTVWTPENKELVYKIWNLSKKKTVDLNRDRIFRELSVMVSHTYKIEDEVVSDEDKRKLIHYEEFQYFYGESERSSRSPLYVIDRSKTDKATTWMRKSDLSRILDAFFDIPASQYGFLCGPGLFDNDGLLRHLFVKKDLGKTVHEWMSNIDRLNLQDLERETLRKALRTTSEAGPHLESWSRGRMGAFYELVELLRKICNADRLELRIMMILYVLDEAFAKEVFKRSLRDSWSLRPDTKEKIVRAPEKLKFYFHFYKINKVRTLGEVPFQDVKMACLLVDVKAAMWKMMVPANDLHTFYNRLDSIVHISSRTAPSFSYPIPAYPPPPPRARGAPNRTQMTAYV